MILRKSLLIATIALQLSTVYAQTHAAHQQTPSVTIKKSIDGSVNPELIPDSVAFSHFLLAVGKDPASKTPDLEVPRRDSYINHFFAKGCGATASEDRSLTPQQNQTLRDLADSAALTLRSYTDSIQKAQGTSSVEDLKTSQAAFLATLLKDLPNRLGADAAAKIQKHLQEMKAKIKLTTVTFVSNQLADSQRQKDQ